MRVFDVEDPMAPVADNLDDSRNARTERMSRPFPGIGGDARLASTRLRVASYSHDTLGLGHIRRSLLVAQAVAQSYLGATTLMIAGAREAGIFPWASGVDCLTLPSIQKGDDGKYRSRRLHLSLPELVTVRARIVQSALEAFAPDVLIVDTEPRGAFRELEPALSTLRMQGRTHCILGLRDVRDEAAVVRREWAKASSEAAIRDYYDQVWVYGDRRVFDVVEEYGLSAEVSARVRYTGFLDQTARLRFVRPGDDGPRLLATLPAGRLILCTVGGGQDGAQLARSFIEAELPPGAFGLVLVGPQMAAHLLDELRERAGRAGRMRVLRFLPEPAPLLERAERLVIMGGYNSTLEAISFGKPTLVVPRVRPRLEQWIRAERMSRLGLLDVLHPDQLSSERIAEWLATDRSPRPAREVIDMDGLDRLVEFLAEREAAVAGAAAS
jgi:predicted glycosyltransferase